MIDVERVGRNADRAIGTRKDIRNDCGPVGFVHLVMCDRLGRNVVRTADRLVQETRTESAEQQPERGKRDQVFFRSEPYIALLQQCVSSGDSIGTKF